MIKVLNNIPLYVLKVIAVVFDVDGGGSEIVHSKSKDINLRFLADTMASSNSLVFNSRVPVWRYKVYLTELL